MSKLLYSERIELNLFPKPLNQVKAYESTEMQITREKKKDRGWTVKFFRRIKWAEEESMY